MGRSKAPPKKPQARGVDFKKFKKKLGRKLPPPTNATNTEVKSKAIILPEQSVALNKEGVPVSKKGLTLKELLHQTSHHNVKVRRDALLGIRELLIKFPAELKLHKNAVIEKLRERISDDDKVVRDTLFQLFKSVILPGCKEDLQGAPVSLIMAYIFKTMTHLAADVRFMAFKFFDLVVQNYPPAFSLYAEKALDNYTDLLQKNQFHMEEKSNLKFTLSALKRCLSLLPSNERDIHSSEQTSAQQPLHAFERDVSKDSTTGHNLIVGKLKDLLPVLINCFYGLISVVRSQTILDSHSFDCMLSILHSIDLIVQYNVYGNGKYQLGLHNSMSSTASPEICIQPDFPSSLLDRLFAVFPMQPARSLSEEDDHYDRRYYILNGIISQIFFTFNQHICALPVLCSRFLSFLKDCLCEIYRDNNTDKAFFDKHLPSLVPFIPYLVSIVDNQEYQLLEAFTVAFVNCRPDSSMKMACLEAVEEMLVLKQQCLSTDAGDREILACQRTWINEIGLLLDSLCNRHHSSSFSHDVSIQHAILHLLLRLGQIGLSNSDLSEEYDKLQNVLQNFYCTSTENGENHLLCPDVWSLQQKGRFLELPKDSQELSICCLYYFSSLKEHLLASLALCCLSDSLKSSVLFRIIEVLHSSYKAGHIHVGDYISFLVTVLSQYETSPGITCGTKEKEAPLVTFRSVTGRVCSFLSQMGDPSLLLQILEDVVLDLISQRLPMENTCALMTMLIAVDSRPTRLSEKSILKLGDIILSYMIDVVQLFPEPEDGMKFDSLCTWHYYLLPCFFLLDRSSVFPKLLLNKMESLIAESSDNITAIVSIFVMMSVDDKMRGVLTSCKAEIDYIVLKILSVQKQSSEMGSMNIEQQHKVQCAVERLKSLINKEFSVIS